MRNLVRRGRGESLFYIKEETIIKKGLPSTNNL